MFNLVRSQMRLLLLLPGVLLLISACQGADSTPPPLATPSTPIADLPVSQSLAERQRLIPTQIPDAIIAEADAEYLLLTNLYERSAPSVVNIEARFIDGNTMDTNRGSGFIFDRAGHIVTNAHVINGADEVVITFDDGFLADGEVIGVDVYSDVAVLAVDVPVNRLLPLNLVNSDGVRVGERAIAIGNPFGLSSSMTVGIVSAVGRQLRSAELIDGSVIPGFQNPRIIQVDTVINPGNSGGPLLNSHGEVMGVNTAIRTDTGRFQGVGFAVPSNTVARVVPELILNGEVDYSWLGVTTFSSDDGLTLGAVVDELDLAVSAGVLISNIMTQSPAQEAGLQGGDQWVTLSDGTSVCAGGDVIVAINGETVQNMDDLVAYLVLSTVPGDTVQLTVVRDNNTFEVPLTLRSRPTSGSENIPCGE